MDSHGLARATVNLIAAGDPAALQLVERRLPGVRASLGTTPLDAAGHARLSAAVADLAEADPVFAESLERALHVRITTNSGPFSGNHVQGDMRVKNRQFHIGRFQFGTGGLVTAVVLFVVLGGRHRRGGVERDQAGGARHRGRQAGTGQQLTGLRHRDETHGADRDRGRPVHLLPRHRDEHAGTRRHTCGRRPVQRHGDTGRRPLHPALDRGRAARSPRKPRPTARSWTSSSTTDPCR